MKSIYYDHNKKDENGQYFQIFNEFVQDNEARGNIVRFPKINDDIIAIKNGKNMDIMIYDIKRHQFIRKLMLESEDMKIKLYIDDDDDGSFSSSMEELD